MLPDNLFFAFLLIFALRVGDVTLGTVRTVFIMQGRRWFAAGIGFVEVMIFVFAITEVIGGLNTPILMVGYAAGFATGNLVGVTIEEKLAFGLSQLRVISRGNGRDVAKSLWDHDFGATLVPGEGRDGPVQMIFSIVPRRHVPKCLKLATEADPDCVVNINDSRYIYRGYIGVHGKRK